MRRYMGAVIPAMMVLGLSLLLTGCSVVPHACAAVGYVPTITVKVKAPATHRVGIQVCDGDLCTAAPFLTPGGNEATAKIRIFPRGHNTFAVSFLGVPGNDEPASVRIWAYDDTAARSLAHVTAHLHWMPRTVDGCAAGFEPQTVMVG